MSIPLKLLIVEDSVIDAELMVMNLTREGFVVDFTRVDSEESYLEALESSYDLILSDWALPQFDGRRALRLLRTKNTDTPFIIVSGSIGEETAVEIMHMGAVDYLLKDRMDRLGQAVKNALEQKRLRDENAAAAKALAISEAELRALFTSMQDLVFVLDQDGYYKKVAPTKINLLAKPVNELLGKKLHEVFNEQKADEFLGVIREVLLTGHPKTIDYDLILNNVQVWFETTVSPLSNDEVIWVARDISERKQAEAQIRLQAAALASAANAIVITGRDGNVEWVNPAFTQLTGYTLAEISGQNPRFLKSGLQDADYYTRMWNTILSGQVWHGELINRRKDGSNYYEEETITPLIAPDGTITQFIGIKQNITARKQSEVSLLKLLTRQTQIASLGRELARTRALHKIFQISYKALKELTGCAFFGITLMDEEKKALQMAYAILEDSEFEPHLFPIMDVGSNFNESVCARVISTHKPVIVSDPHEISQWPLGLLDMNGQSMRSACCLPMLANDKVIGLIELQNSSGDVYSAEDLEWLSVVANQMGLSIQNARLFAEIQRRIAELSSLSEIDNAVISHAEPETIYTIFLKQVINRLNVDAVELFIYKPDIQMIECVADTGFSAFEFTRRARLKLGESLAGSIAQEQKLIRHNLQGPIDLRLKYMVEQEGFKDYFGLPLIADDQLIGVLEIYNRSKLSPDEDWLRFLEILCNQAAVAINTIRLYEHIQTSRDELLNAYDLTIEGWSKAMDLRDRETEDHTRRVTDLTLRLAQHFGVDESQLVHYRRGALLHDIGKLGVPDRILSKPGQLNDEEWVIMRTHPQLAYDMLVPIEYLRPALDIPYCHHEKWDGSGYPRGLKGEEIPFAARLFALVDVFDALTSDRPYRAAWPVQRVFDYIREQSGKHFDPRVVEVFFSMWHTGELRQINSGEH